MAVSARDNERVGSVTYDTAKKPDTPRREAGGTGQVCDRRNAMECQTGATSTIMPSFSPTGLRQSGYSIRLPSPYLRQGGSQHRHTPLPSRVELGEAMVFAITDAGLGNEVK